MSTTLSKSHTYFIRRNEYSLNEGWKGFGDGREGSFYSMEKTETDYSDNGLFPLKIRFALDPTVQIFNRESTTLFEVFGTIGGIFEIFNIISGMFVGVFAKYSFRKSILKSIRAFKDKNSKNKKEENNNERPKLYEQNDIEKVVMKNKIHSYQPQALEESKEEINEFISLKQEKLKGSNNFLLQKMEEQTQFIMKDSTKKRMKKNKIGIERYGNYDD